MDAERTEIGIVCGQCDEWNPMGAAACSSCENELSLVPRRSIPPKAQPAAEPAAASSAQARDRVSSTTPGRERLGGLASEPGGPRKDTRSGMQPPAAGAPAPLRKPSALAMMAMRSNPPPRATSPAGTEGPAQPSQSSSAAEKLAARSTTTPVSPQHPPNAQAGKAQAEPAAPKGPAPKPEKLPPLDFSKLSQEELMEQARHYVCRSCSSGVPMGHKFCGRCGEAVPPEILSAQTLFFGDMQNPAKAKLILIRGEGMDGLSFHLKAEQHIVGRDGQLPFPDDPFVSRRHANFFYRNGKLVVRDEGSLNGVYMRVRGTVELAPGDSFLAGEQLFRLDLNPKAADGQAPDGTYFYSSPKHPSTFRLVQILQGGALGMAVCARGNTLLIGREGGDLNFPGDLYMSGSHCRIEEAEGRFTLSDLNSRNGTYLRLKSERELGHGDYLFIGRKLLRVELNTN
ncbi:MAG: FHA domain-containing protein [Polyangiaceae bacterium]|nr:FHA domain-containing protein [Polyangiaceae bacterium]